MFRNTDALWTQIRNILVLLGGLLVGASIGTTEEVQKVVEGLGAGVTAIGGLIYAGTTIWQWYIRWNTRSVSLDTASRADVPTINPATGERESGTQFPKEKLEKAEKVEKVEKVKASKGSK